MYMKTRKIGKKRRNLEPIYKYLENRIISKTREKSERKMVWERYRRRIQKRNNKRRGINGRKQSNDEDANNDHRRLQKNSRKPKKWEGSRDR